MVASVRSAAKWCSSTISARVSSGVAQKSASGSAPSSNQGRTRPEGRPKTSVK